VQDEGITVEKLINELIVGESPTFGDDARSLSQASFARKGSGVYRSRLPKAGFMNTREYGVGAYDLRMVIHITHSRIPLHTHQSLQAPSLFNLNIRYLQKTILLPPIWHGFRY
jgi:hypothetical protein